MRGKIRNVCEKDGTHTIKADLRELTEAEAVEIMWLLHKLAI